MSAEVITITDRQQWLEERAKDVTSTEVSALYGLSPYKTEFELFHEKRENQIVSIAENERMKWGNRLESIIAHSAAEDYGWEIAKLNVYMRKPEYRMGSSFDFEILSSSDGPGILEIKNVDGLQYAKKWIDDGQGNIEAPEHIEMQIQHQMEVADREWTALVALVGGNQLKTVYRQRDREIGADLRAKVADFWERVFANVPPPADYSVDADFIIKLHQRANEGELLEADHELDALIWQYQLVSKEADAKARLKDEFKAKILERIGTASKVISQYGSLSCSMTKESPGTLVTPEMVGTYIGGRKGFRNFRFTAKKEK